MSFIKVYIHFVWATVNREPLLHSLDLREKMWNHIKENQNPDFRIVCVGGHKQHCHCLVSMGNKDSISKVAQLIKGESSRWMNLQGKHLPKFQWQNEYFAISVSESQVDNVISYIKNQERHHARFSFEKEYESILEKSQINNSN